VLFANALQPSALLRAEIDTRRGALAVTPNEEVNLLFIQKASRLARSLQLFTVLKRLSRNISPKMVEDTGAKVLFGKPVDVEFWSVRIRRKEISIQYWEPPENQAEKNSKAEIVPLIGENAGVALAVLRNGILSPMGGRNICRKGDQIVVLVFAAERQKLEKELKDSGWHLVQVIEGDEFSTSQCLLEPTN
jgi:Trk K+ transport system NAD-binding subunit